MRHGVRLCYAYGLGVCLLGMSVPLLMGPGCPGFVSPGGMMSGYGDGSTSGQMLLFQQFASAPFSATFSPSQTGVTIRVIIFSDDGSSRPTLTVTDAAGTTVASAMSPTDNLSEAAFTAQSTDTFTVSVAETAAAGSRYAVTVTEWSNGSSSWGPGGMMGGMMGSGWVNGSPAMLLQQTFTAAPFTATFTAATTDEALRVVVSGNDAGSRLVLTVTDPSGNAAATVTDPTSSGSQVTFTPASTGTYTVSVSENGTASTSYLLRVMQSDRACPMCPYMWP